MPRQTLVPASPTSTHEAAIPPAARQRLSARGLALACLLVAAPAAADFRMEKPLDLRPGGELLVEVSGGGVVVTGDGAGGPQVVITGDRDDAAERFTFDITSNGSQARVISRRKDRFRWFSWGNGDRLRYEIRVPRQTRVEVSSSGGGIRVSALEGETRLSSSGGGVKAEDVVGTVDAESSGGGLEVRRIRGDVRLDSSGGGIDVFEVVGNVDVETSGGGIDVNGVDGDVNASTSGGGVRVTAVSGRLVAESSGGPVTAELTDSAGGRLSSSGGGVRVSLSPHAKVTIDASSSGGRVTCDLPVTVRGTISKHELRGDLNGGGPELELRSSGGGIRIDSGREE